MSNGKARFFWWLSVAAFRLRLRRLGGWAHVRWLQAHCAEFRG